MFATLRVVWGFAIAFVLTAGVACADCCAPGRAQVIVYGLQGGHGVGRLSGAATPFAGTLNPRYANPQAIGGPVGPAGPSVQFVRQPLVSYSQIASLPSLQTPAFEASEQVQAASDAEVMQLEPWGQPSPQPTQQQDSEEQSPSYPGQHSTDRFATATTESRQEPTSEPRSLRRTSAPVAPARTRSAHTTAAQRLGAFASPSAMRLSRSLQLSGHGL